MEGGGGGEFSLWNSLHEFEAFAWLFLALIGVQKYTKTLKHAK